MTSIERLKAVLAMVAAKQAGPLVPLAREHRKDFDAYHIIFTHDDRSFAFRGLDGDQVLVEEWVDTDRRYVPREPMSLQEVLQAEPVVTHYWGPYSLEWTDWAKVPLGTWSVAHLKARLLEARRWVEDRWFERRKIRSAERMEVLNGIWDLELLAKTNFTHEPGVSQPTLMIHLHGESFYRLPNCRAESSRVSHILGSLVDGKELVKSGAYYRVTGIGAQAIERTEEEDRRHGDAMRAQRRIFFLTMVIVLSAVAQAGLIKAPALFEFDRWPWQPVERPVATDVSRVD